MLNNMRESEVITEMAEVMDRVRTECSEEHSPDYSNKTTAWTWSDNLGDSNNEIVGFVEDKEIAARAVAFVVNNSNNEIVGLVEDKEIAARAVAFVVNSTRKGIIPLCADVAHLMRSKQCLERKLYMLKKENEAFRSSASAVSLPSHSMSPTPPSLSSYTENCIKALQEQSLAVQQELYRSNSRCSNSSSTYSYSPKMDKHHGGTARLFGVQYSPVTDPDTRKTASQSNRFKHSVNSGFQRSQPSFSKHYQDKKTSITADINENDGATPKKNFDATEYEYAENGDIKLKDRTTISMKTESDKLDVAKLPEYTNAIGEMVTALNFHIEDETKGATSKQKYAKEVEVEIADVVENDITDKPPIRRSLLERRRVSLPEMTSLPSEHVMRIRPKQSKQVQCSMVNTESDQDLEDQFMKSVRINAKLEEELNNARKEIDQLKKRLMRVEASGAIPKSYNYADDDKSAEDNGYYTGSNRTSRNSSEHEKSSGLAKSSKRHPIATYTGPLPNCKCSSCQDALGSDDDISQYCDQYLDEPRFAISNKLQVQIGDYVTTKNYRSGYIRYIGHVDKLTNQTNSLFVGLETDDPVGSHDGFFRGKRYFYCKDKHGIIIPLAEIVGKISKKPQSKSSKEDNLKTKKHTRKSSTRDDKITQL